MGLRKSDLNEDVIVLPGLKVIILCTVEYILGLSKSRPY